MGETRLDIAELLVTSVAGCHDPTADLSPSLSERVAPLLQSIRAELGTVLGDRLSDFEALGRQPYQPALRAHLQHVVAAKLALDPRLEQRLRLLLLHLAEFGRLLPHHGARADELPDTVSLSEQIRALQSGRAVPRPAGGPRTPDIEVVLSFRCRDEYRLRNLLCCLAAVLEQNLSRSRYALTAVEQDSEPRVERVVAPLVDRYVFAKNAGTYNYAWGRNVGFQQGCRAAKLCWLDTDVVVPPTFLESCLGELQNDVEGLLPYDRALCLDERSSSAVALRLASGAGLPELTSLRGHVMSEVYGFAVAATQQAYERLGGQDERYRGWGEEDNEFYFRLRETTEVRRRPGWILHLDHPRPDMRIAGKRINAAAIQSPRTGVAPFGRIDRYEGEDHA